MVRDARRTLLVVGVEADLFVALRERLESHLLAVRWCEPSDAKAAINNCAPWPWAVAGDSSELAPPVADLLARRPVLALWLGRRPAGLPAHSLAYDRWTQLADDVRQRLTREVLGLRLAPNRGLLTGANALLLAPELEALVAVHPCGLEVPARALAPAKAALVRLGLPLRLKRGGGRTTLTEAP